MVLALAAALVAVPACGSTSRQRRASVLGYLYPEGKEAVPATDVHLELPLAIGLAFVPESMACGEQVLTAGQKQALLERVRRAFADTPEFERIELIPAAYVSPGGGFENLDQIRRTLGIDLVVLVSFDQAQYDDPNNLASLTYWTIVGAYVVPGNEDETHTFVHASVFDLESRALLLNATGQSVVEGRTTPVDIERSLREDRVKGFGLAVDDLIANLGVALGEFRAQVETGTVRGQGTPAIEVTAAGDVAAGPGGGGTGAGAAGLLELALGVLVLGAARGRRRRS
jgi:rhombotail lipoprotein